ncbi:MAG TPA: molybdopterin molybdotransferase MoeA, partial [Nitrospiria bacterium]
RVSVLATGDELAEPGEEAGGGQIINSNSYALAAQVVEAGGIPEILGIAKDTPESLREKLRRAASSDLVVISGGVSVGDFDFVKDVLSECGAVLNFWRVAMKPGAPMAYGTLREKPVFALPGNPVSAMVTFELFVRPLLKRMQGLTRIYRAVIEAVLAESYSKPAGKTHFLRAVLEKHGGRYSARPVKNQSSGRLTSMAEADGLMIAPADALQLEAGGNVAVLLMNGGGDQDQPGY